MEEGGGVIPPPAPPADQAVQLGPQLGTQQKGKQSGVVAKTNTKKKVQETKTKSGQELATNKKQKEGPRPGNKVKEDSHKQKETPAVQGNKYHGRKDERGFDGPGRHRDTRCTGRTQSQVGSNDYQHGRVPPQGVQGQFRGHGAQGGINKRGHHQDARFPGRNPNPGGNRDHPNDDGRKTQNLGYTRLLELAQKDPSEVVLVVANTKNGYYDLLKGALRPDIMILVVKVLAKVCQVDFKENKTSVLASACNAKFLENLAYHIASIPTDTNATRKAGIPNFFQDLFTFCGTVMDLLPNTACEHLGPTLMLVKGAMDNASAFQRITFTKVLTDRHAELQALLKKLMDEREKKPVKETSRNETLKHQPPPDDFRELSIFPLPEDILTREKAFVRPNIVEGAYDSIEHYLDVQFRLLREDFVWPLRDGITDYMQQLAVSQKISRKTNNIRIYHNVKFLHSTVQRDKVGFVVTFNTKTTASINWEHSKRFMFGSLLCFTNNNFTSVMFGTILDRNVAELRRGQITVELTFDSEMLDLFHSEFIMVESEVYFEPYYHVLKALQVMKGEDFPMSRYIVHVQPDTNPPQYTAEAPDYLYTILEEFQVPVLTDDAWPIAEDLALDDSQYRAFKSALTKEFVVIQGPPGTGKTYLGLKIAATIINNMKQILDRPNHRNDVLVDRQRHSPLLVVCFTNHALDQFLEGLLPTTENMVRVGGQSRSDVLKPHNLREKRNAKRRYGDMQRLSKDIHNRMARLMADLKGIQEDVQHLDNNIGVVSIASIEEVYRHANVACFVGDDGKLSDDLFLDWLVSEEEMYDEQQEVKPDLDLFPGDEPPVPEEEEDPVPREDENDRQRGPDDDFDLEELPVNMKLRFFLHLKSKKKAAEELKVAIKKLEEARDSQWQMKVWMLETHHRRCRYIAHKLQNKPKLSPDEARKLMQRNVYLWKLNMDQRWALYHTWVARLRTALLEELRLVEVRYRAESSKYLETRHMEDLKLIEGADVIGMTTTGAARLQPLLQALKCRVVIVEEAAEVMESHIVVSLTSHCQHLILIGDHQQLRPTTAVYKLARDFHFDISLFERMLRNGLHCEVLRVQHRMRPEIARLIVPSIYKELHNHESVLHFKPVQGVTKSLFFLDHSSPEQEIGETHSRRNTFEADMLLRLCRYLLLQGYPPERITILATYSGQMFYLRNQRSKSLALKDVQMTIVDNFQGEENDIILLSLVRNNKENNVGFLRTENRVCVALSRAKLGMYIMGNMDNLTNNSSSVWVRIKEALDEQKAVGEVLTLCCPVHKEQLTEIRMVDDFDKVPEGGCRLPCATALVCGHVCVRVCHSFDREHKKYDCREPCTRTPPNCGLQHPCPKLCGTECGDCKATVQRQLPCDHSKLLPCHVDHVTYKCWVQVPVTAPDCGHTFEKPCHKDVESCSCPFPCDVRLDCGHTCARTCHATDDPNHEKYECCKSCPKKNVGCTQDHMCARKCYVPCGTCCVPVLKKAPTCDHVYTVDCARDPEDIQCRMRCEKTLPCGHPCRLQCYQACGDCKVMVKKTVADSDCNHVVTIECGQTPQRRHCQGPCQRSMSCGHRCNRPCKVACSESNTCEELVAAPVRPACGHDMRVHCKVARRELESNSPLLLQHCRQPCNSELQCGHRCQGTCGLCLQGRIHQGCRAKCGRVLICGHACSVPCAQACPPCRKKCRMRCVHNRCNRTCGEPCVRCQEPCLWRCPHKRCTKRCWQMCNRDPCYEPCKKKLPCKHPCIGFCGEDCPRLCRVCDREEVEAIVFGHEDEPDARFVYLADCKHTIESRAFETWLTQRRDEVSMPQCPLCKTDIMTNMRYMNSVKQVLRDIYEIKKRIFGEFRAIENGRAQLINRLMDIRPHPVPVAEQPRHARNFRTLLERQRRALNTPPVQPPGPGKVLTRSGEDLYRKLHQQLYVDNYAHNRHNRQHINLSTVDLQSATIQVEIFLEVQKSFNEVRPHTTGVALQTLVERTDLILAVLLKRDRMNRQEVADINLELRRFHRVAHLCQLEAMMNRQTPVPEGIECLIVARGIAFSIERYSNELDRTLGDTVKQLSAILKANMVTDKERREIVAAVGLSQGHWFKCPNGHFYAIGECGGAMEVGKCSECGAAIGGTRHRLLPNNRLATELDGATRSAWPGAAMNL